MKAPEQHEKGLKMFVITKLTERQHKNLRFQRGGRQKVCSGIQKCKIYFCHFYIKTNLIPSFVPLNLY